MNDVATQVLLDTVAEVSLLSHKWMESKVPGTKILEVGKLLDPCDRLQVQWDNHTERYHSLGGSIQNLSYQMNLAVQLNSCKYPF